jgi:hypothetical protein
VGPVKIFAVSTSGDVQLPPPQRAEVKPAAADSVQMTFYCPAEERDEDPTPFSISLAPGLARDLAIRLWLAADKTGGPLEPAPKKRE